MVRTKGKLIPFLEKGLEKGLFPNLKWESDGVFYFQFPRYQKAKFLKEFEVILQKWYEVNGKSDMYPGYSTAKAVFQAGIKKSIYLMPLERIGTKLRFRFATKEEAKNKKMLQKERAHSVSLDQSLQYLDNLSESETEDPFMHPGFDASSPNPPPSESSSGYHSDTDNSECDIPKIVDAFMEEGTTDYTSDEFNYMFNELMKMVEKNMGDIPLLENTVFDDILDLSEQNPNVDTADLSQPVMEVNATPVDTSEFTKLTTWVCSQKVDLGTLLILICEKQPISDGDRAVLEGQVPVMIPIVHDEPGVTYEIKHANECGGKLVCLCLPSRSI